MCIHIIGRDSNDCILCAELLSNRTEPGEPGELRRRDSEIDRLAAENAARIAERDSLVELLSLVNEEALKVEKERDALKARIDGGIRVKAVKIDVSHDCRNYGPRHPAHNATLILDEGVEI